MLRRLMIGLGALGLALVIFGVYRGYNPPPAKPTTSMPSVTIAPGSMTTSASQQRSIPGIGNIALAPGSKAEFKVFDTKGQLQYLLQADEWSPSDQENNEIRVTKPSLSKFMRDGQILQVTAEQGVIVAEQTGKSFRPKRGTLTQNVEIHLDRTTRRWRLEHPGKEAMDHHPEQIIHISMDTLYFDDDLSLIRTDGPVKLRSEEFDVDSKGLSIVYSRPYDRLEHLEILQGGTIELRGVVDMENNSLLGSGPAASRKAPATPARPKVTEAAASQAAGDSPNEDVEAADLAPPAPRFVDIYQASFEGPVHMRQFRQQQVIAKLDADKLLDLTFDLGPQNRQSAEVANGDKSNGSASATRPAEATEKSRVLLTWTGKLDIRAIQRLGAEKATRTTIIHAEGEKVVLTDQENTIECNELQYNAVRRCGEVLATAPAMAKITDAHGRYLAGHDIRFDQSGVLTGTLDIIGAGEAAEAAGGSSLVVTDAKAGATSPMRIVWHKGLSMQFRRASLPCVALCRAPLPLQLPDRRTAMLAMYQGVFEIAQPRASQSLGAGPLRGLVAQTAVIAGNALVQRAEESICSDHLEIAFFATAGEGQVFGPIRTARGTGGVSLVSQAGAGEKQSRTINSEELDVQFKRLSADHSNPTHALAVGKAVIVQGPSRIEADRIDATLKPAVEVTPADAATASRPAAGKQEQRIIVSDLLADGHVRITDPKRPMDLTANHLQAEMDANQAITHVLVDGQEDQPATVSTAEYSLTAPRIQGDLRSQDVTVPSAGHLTLLVNQDLQGQRLSKSQPLKITWSDHMRMYGEKNLAEFTGKVQAVQTNPATHRNELEFSGDKMLVYLRPAAQEAAREEAAPPSTPQRLTNLLDKAREQFTEAFPAAEAWISPRKAADRTLGPSSTGREPIKIVTEGNATAVLPRYDATGNIMTNRMLIVGPIFEIDLDRQQLEVEGKGNLLVENYGLAALANDPRASDPKAVAAEARGRPDSGLSQTVFTWKTSMVFIMPDREAVFDDTVNMIHLSGGSIRFGSELASALGAKIDLLKALPGREATLNCDTLCVQFGQEAQKGQTDDPWMQRARLQKLTAEGKMVSLDEHLSTGGTNMVTAGRLQYNGQRDTFVVQRSAAAPAQLIQQKDATAISSTTAGDTFFWERNSDKGPGHDKVKIVNLRGQTMQ